MPITSTIAPAYFWKLIIMAIVCAALAVWGGIDLWWTIPANEKRYADFMEFTAKRAELQQRVDTGEHLVGDDLKAYELLEEKLEGIETPHKPNTFDRLVQWMFISCILGVPWCFMQIKMVKQESFTLQDDGSLILRAGAETWPAADIASMDMERWMSKSIAYAVHRDGRRVKMDAYQQKHLEKVIGGIAHRFNPRQWNADGTKVKPAAAAEPGLDDHARGPEDDIAGDDSHNEPKA